MHSFMSLRSPSLPYKTARNIEAVQNLLMIGGFPVERLSAEIFLFAFASRDLSRRPVVTLSRIASLDRRAERRTIRRSVPKHLRLSQYCDHGRPSFRRIHWWTGLSDRGRGGFPRSVARVHRQNSRRPDRADAVLWAHARRSGAQSQRLADARARTGRRSAWRLTAEHDSSIETVLSLSSPASRGITNQSRERLRGAASGLGHDTHDIDAQLS